MPPTILITRPETSALSFADQIRARLGCDVPIVLSPLIRIEHTGPLPDLSGVQTLIFTSRHGVEAFAALTDRRDFNCFAVGNATAEAIHRAGMHATTSLGGGIDLTRRILANKAHGRCLHLRGEYAAVNIEEILNNAGIETGQAIIYRQTECPLKAQALDVLQGEQPVILPLFSPRSAKIFFDQSAPKAPLLVAAISENVTQMVPGARAKMVKVASRPDSEAVLDTVAGLYMVAKRLEGGNPAQ